MKATLLICLVLCGCGRQGHIDCAILMGGWHPDIPRSVAQQCEKERKHDKISNDARKRQGDSGRQ